MIERSKPISGESLRVIILRVASTVTVVLNGGKSSRLCQPSSKVRRASGSYRPDAFDTAPRPRRRSASTSGLKSPADAGRGIDELRRAVEWAMGPILAGVDEQNKNNQRVRGLPAARKCNDGGRLCR